MHVLVLDAKLDAISACRMSTAGTARHSMALFKFYIVDLLERNVV
jgi:hypothetical protein